VISRLFQCFSGSTFLYHSTVDIVVRELRKKERLLGVVNGSNYLFCGVLPPMGPLVSIQECQACLSR